MRRAQPRVLVDADILIKLSVFDVFAECLTALGFKVSDCATMQSMKFSAGLNKPQVRDRKAGVGAPSARLLATLQAIPSLDNPTIEEQQLSAQVVRQSQALGLAIDAGEAIVMSVCVLRQLPYVTTGDKKAVRSLPHLEPHIQVLAKLKGRIVPLEYLLLRLVQHNGFAAVRSKLVAGAYCDMAVSRALQASGTSAALFERAMESKLAQLQSEAPGYVASYRNRTA
jgi:hypothetical protein